MNKRLAILLRQVINNRFYNISYKHLLTFVQPKKTILDNGVGITTLLCHKYVSMFIFNINSLFYSLGFSLPICVFDDGSLTKNDKKILYRLLSVKITSTKTADTKMRIKLKKYDSFFSYRFDEYNPVSKRKWDAYLLSPFKKTIYLDSDLLFFQKSEILWKWINKPSDIVLHLEHSKGLIKHHNQPEDFDYIFRTLISRTSTPLVSESFNTGLLAIPNSSIFDLTKINNVFKIFNKSYYSRVFNSEETAVAAALVNKSCFSLPSETHVVACWTQEYEMLKSINPKKKLALLHYVYELKQFFERDAVELFFTNNFFRLPR